MPSPLIRIGLMQAGNAASLVLKAEGGARLTGPDGGEAASGVGPWTLNRSGSAYLVSDAQGHTLGVLQEGSRWTLRCETADALACFAAGRGAWRRYRGSLEIGLRSGRLQIVNEVALETYLRGVVSREMGAAPPEALKAQAVAARTYAVSHIGQWAAQGYDLRDSTDSQVYAGADGETSDSDAAVLATSGLILMKDGLPIAAQFCADCGGASLPEPGADYVHDDDAHGINPSNPPAWSFTIPATRLLALLQPALKFPPAPVAVPLPPDENDTLDPTAAMDTDIPVVPAPTAAVPVLDTLKTTETDGGGRIRKLRYTWHTGMKPKQKAVMQQAEISGNALRNLLGVNTLRSTLFTVKQDANGNFIFTGRGWGHGHGLCQTGAIALAAEPFRCDYRAILARYYPAAVLGRLAYLEPEDEAGQENTALQAPPAKAKLRQEAELDRR